NARQIGRRRLASAAGGLTIAARWGRLSVAARRGGLGGTRRWTQHLETQVFLREDQRPLLGEKGICTRMVGMNMCVDQDFDWPIGERPDRRERLVSHLSVLGL